MSEETRDQLRRAWDTMIADFERARDAIDQPERMPAPGNDRNLAEGYRYLMGYIHSAVERAFHSNPDHPFIRHALQIVNKATIDNSDAIYFQTRIDGRQRYLVRGRAADHRHWRGDRPADSGPLAPQYVIFEVSQGPLAGDTGSLAELRPGIKTQTGKLDSSEIEVDGDGCFEILLAPEKPDGYRGNFIETHRRSERPDPTGAAEGPDRFADYLSGRQLFYDWGREEAVPLTIESLDHSGVTPAAYTPPHARDELTRCGELVRGQMHFWNEFYTVLLETYGKREGEEGERFMPRNKFNEPNAAARETGGGQSTNIYAGGVYELGEDEALIVESRVKVPPQYIGFHLSNLWGESHDFANHQSSLNGKQMEIDSDGVLRWVVAHRDPGVPNWVDTTGHPEGYLVPRWAYSKTPDKEDWPTVSAKKVVFSEIRNHLPAGTRNVSAEERRERIRERQLHIQGRYPGLLIRGRASPTTPAPRPGDRGGQGRTGGCECKWKSKVPH